MNFLQMQEAIATYLKNEVSDFIINGYNFLQPAINQARHRAELLHDFYYAQTQATLSISSNGASLVSAMLVGGVAPPTNGVPQFLAFTSIGITQQLPSAACIYVEIFNYTQSNTSYTVTRQGSATTFILPPYTSKIFHVVANADELSLLAHTGDVVSIEVWGNDGTGPVSIKRVRHVSLPLSDGEYFPIEFMTDEEFTDRIRRQIGRQPYSATSTLAQYGISADNPTAYQDGLNLFLSPASEFNFPVTALLDVIQFQPDYVNDTDTDFFLENCPDYIQWQAIVEGNRYWQQLVPRQEGSVQEQSVIEAAQISFQAMIQWDTDIRASTSTPAVPQQGQQSQQSRRR